MNKKIIVPILCIALAVGMLSGCTEEEEPTNEAPVAMFTVPDNVYVDTEFTFTDASTDDSAIASWSWDFDADGVEDSAVQNPLYTFTAIGEYEVTLTVTDDEEETHSYTGTVTVEEMPPAGPVAAFEYTPMENITIETPVTFTDSSTVGDTNITIWMWDFGDETNSTDQNPEAHTYAAAADYTVTLTVTDENELTDTYEMTITVA